MRAVNQVLFDVIPDPARSGEKFLVAGNLEGVKKSNHGFGLWPAFPSGVDYFSAPAFVSQSAVGADAFGQRHFSHAPGRGLNPLEQRGVAQDASGFAEQPRRLNIMAEGVSVRADVPLLIEKMI